MTGVDPSGNDGNLSMASAVLHIGVRVTVNAVNAELQRRGYNALLAKAAGYFYFWSGEAADWLDRTVRVERVSDLSIEEWVHKFLELRQHNAEIMQTGRKPPARARRAGG